MNDVEEAYMEYLEKCHDKYIALVCLLVFGSTPKLVDDHHVLMQFDCNAIKAWLYRNEPERMSEWWNKQRNKKKKKNEQC